MKSFPLYAVIAFTVLLQSTFLNFSWAQNCAIPHLVTLPLNESVQTECAKNGTILASLSTRNIRSVISVSVTPHNFTRVEFDENGFLSLIVDQPLFQTTGNNNDKTYIDETWSQVIEAQLELECSDGINKTVLFSIPIADQNTQPPFFEYENYSLIMGPCVTGTHEEACPLNFETPIVVFDADRDFINADMDFITDHPELIRISSSIVTINPRSVDIGPNHLMRNVRMYLQESNFEIGDVFEFIVTVYNNGSLSPSQERLSANTSITIRFGQSPISDNETALKPPVFSSNAYYAIVTNVFDALPGTELRFIKPDEVAAYRNSIDSLNPLGYGDDYGPNPGGGDDNKLTVRYHIQSESDILKINNKTGKLYFSEHIQDFLQDHLDTSAEYLFEITAVFDTYDFLPAKVPLLLFFNTGIKDCTPEPPMCTTIPACPDCPPDCPQPTTGKTCGDSTDLTTPYGVTDGSTSENPNNHSTPHWEITSTTTKLIPSESPTTAQTTESVTRNGTQSTPDPTHPSSISSTPSTIPPTPTTTTAKPLPSSEASTIFFSTIRTTTVFETTDTDLTTPTSPVVTEAPGMTTITPTDSTTEYTTSSTIPSVPTSAAPTAPPDSTTTNPTSKPHTTTNFWTSSIPTTSLITSTSTNPTTPIDDDCCSKCNIVPDFECPDFIPQPNILFPDPHDCQTFYRCIWDEHSFSYIPLPQSCENDIHIFCPDQQACVVPGDCTCTDFPPNDNCNTTLHPELPQCENCNCYPGSDSENTCNKYPDDIPENGSQIPDLKYYDIFHVCTIDPNANGYTDCVIPCPAGTVYCVMQNRCDHATNVECKTGKIPYKCKPCLSYYLTRGVHLSGYEYDFNV